MVKVLPLPVCPYAKMHTLKPSSADCTSCEISSKQSCWLASGENTRSNVNVCDLVMVLPSVDDVCSVSSMLSLSSPKKRAWMRLGSALASTLRQYPLSLFLCILSTTTRHLPIAGRTRQNTRILPLSSCSLSWSFLRNFSFSSNDRCNSRMYRPLDSICSDSVADASSASADAVIKFYHTHTQSIHIPYLRHGAAAAVTFFFSRLLRVAASNSANDPSTWRFCVVSAVFSRSSSSMALFALLYSNSMVLSSDSNPTNCFLRLSLE